MKTNRPVGPRAITRMTEKSRATIALTVLALPLAAFLFYLWPRPVSAEEQYERILWQMFERLETAGSRYQTLEESPREELGRVKVLGALKTALANAECLLMDVDRVKVRAIAEDLERTGGAAVRTRQGAYELWARFEEACPSLPRYAPMLDLRELQASGDIPRSRVAANPPPQPTAGFAPEISTKTAAPHPAQSSGETAPPPSPRG